MPQARREAWRDNFFSGKAGFRSAALQPACFIVGLPISKQPKLRHARLTGDSWPRHFNAVQQFTAN